MNIDDIANILLRHNRTFQMPARSSIPPWRWPRWFAFLLWLPEYKIKRIFLLILTGHKKLTVSGTQIVNILLRKLSIIRELSCAEINRSIYFVCIALLDQRLYHRDHIRDFLRCLRMCRCFFYMKRCHILLALCNVALGNHGRIHTFFIRALDDLVIDIGKV